MIRTVDILRRFSIDKDKEEKGLRDLFEIGLVLKAVDGTLEILGAILVSIVPRAAIDAALRYVFAGELVEDPKDWLANVLLHATPGLSGGLQAYAGLVLFVHGAIKIFLVAAILRGKFWAYPVAIAVFAGFAAYQFYELALGYSLFLWVITVMDVFVIALVVHEYRYMKRGRSPAGA